jgi:predicted dehydrogenase
MDRQIIICGGPDIEARTRAYLQLVGRRRVSVASRIAQFSDAIVDVRGALSSKRLIPAWQQHRCTVISDGPLARSLAESHALLDRGDLLLALPSLCDQRHQVILGQTAKGTIGDLVAVRLVRLLPLASPLWDSITLTYGLDPLALLQALGGPVERTMAQEQSLVRRRPDTLFAVGTFKGGAIFCLELSAAYPHNYRSERIEVVGTKGILEYDSDLDHALRLTTATGTTYHNAQYEPTVHRMLKDCLQRMDDPVAMKEHSERGKMAVDFLFRTMDSADAHEAR